MDAIKSEYNNRILYRYYYGLISVENIKKSWLDTIENNEIPDDVKGFVLDYRKAHFGFHIKRYTEVSGFYREHPETFRYKRIAYITENPDDIVFPILIQTQDDGYETRPFSTMEAAVEWVCEVVPAQRSKC